VVRAHTWQFISLVAAFLALPLIAPGTVPAAENGSDSVIAVTLSESGEVILVDRSSLEIVRRVSPAQPPREAFPMLVVEDVPRQCFYVGNFEGGIGCLAAEGDEQRVIDVGGPVIGLAISPDGKWLAANGARDLRLRLIDLEQRELRSTTALGNAADPPKHSHLTHGLASTHPWWLPDSSGIVTQDNLHEEIVLVDRLGKVSARRSMPSAVHSFLSPNAETLLAIAEGTVDGTVPPQVIVLSLPELKIVRSLEVPMAENEPAKLHHGALSPDGQRVVVANMGPIHGPHPGRTVACFRWNDGQLLWHTTTVSNAGHVQFLSPDRVVVLGHRDAELLIVDARSGEHIERWTVPDADELGHALAVEPAGNVLVLNASTGQVMRVGPTGFTRQSIALGPGLTEASLPE